MIVYMRNPYRFNKLFNYKNWNNNLDKNRNFIKALINQLKMLSRMQMVTNMVKKPLSKIKESIKEIGKQMIN